ncbi:hypothetical protein FHX34_10571 [Actinoplanes teichomyceticus]|uniref:Uncharacterized protein n=1 Tax=Actinoplanes teichomyceticus TaxID=1867 RepID=A0A561VKU4_ACTTI|nr:hypothetical protein FHX34_10571 [Actinoplanes teichomyceticus]
MRSVDALRAGDYTFTRTGAYLTADITHGAVHLPDGALLELGQAAMMRVGDATYLRYLIHGNLEERDLYMKYRRKAAAPGQLRDINRVYALLDGKHWVRVDEKRLAAAAAIEEQSGLDSMPTLPGPGRADGPDAEALIKAVTTARRSGDTITGTLDATRVDPDLDLLFSDPTYLYGPRAKAMSYRAVLDERGRLAELTVEMPDQLASQPPEPADPEPPVVITISQYGRTEPPRAPADAETLPLIGYEMLANDVD